MISAARGPLTIASRVIERRDSVQPRTPSEGCCAGGGDGYIIPPVSRRASRRFFSSRVQPNSSAAVATGNGRWLPATSREWPVRRGTARRRFAVTCRTRGERNDGRASDRRRRRRQRARPKRERSRGAHVKWKRHLPRIEKPVPSTTGTNEVVSFEGHGCDDIKRRFVFHRRRSAGHVAWLSISRHAGAKFNRSPCRPRRLDPFGLPGSPFAVEKDLFLVNVTDLVFYELYAPLGSHSEPWIVLRF